MHKESTPSTTDASRILALRALITEHNRLYYEQAQPTVTIGSDQGTAEALQELGAVHCDSPVDACVIDEANRIASTAAFMYEAPLKDIYTGIDALVVAVKDMLDASVSTEGAQ